MRARLDAGRVGVAAILTRVATSARVCRRVGLKVATGERDDTVDFDGLYPYLRTFAAFDELVEVI